ncbi:hypothetical protein ACLOJK_011398 [Asimina triloba]
MDMEARRCWKMGQMVVVGGCDGRRRAAWVVGRLLDRSSAADIGGVAGARGADMTSLDAAVRRHGRRWTRWVSGVDSEMGFNPSRLGVMEIYLICWLKKCWMASLGGAPVRDGWVMSAGSRISSWWPSFLMAWIGHPHPRRSSHRRQPWLPVLREKMEHRVWCSGGALKTVYMQ